MDNYVSIDVYIDKNRNIFLIPYKRCRIGYDVAVKPIINIRSDEWKNVSQHILKLLNEICVDPVTEETESTILKELCGSKGFGQFSKKHICISVEQKIGVNKIETYNSPRLPDGSYGTEKGDISEQYSIKYVSEKEEEMLQENFEKAYRDAERYLTAIES